MLDVPWFISVTVTMMPKSSTPNVVTCDTLMLPAEPIHTCRRDVLDEESIMMDAGIDGYVCTDRPLFTYLHTST